MGIGRLAAIGWLALAFACERHCPEGQHWFPGSDYCRYDQPEETYCSCGTRLVNTSCVPCEGSDLDAHHASGSCELGAAPRPLPGPVTLATDVFELRFMSDESGEDLLTVTSTGRSLLDAGYSFRFSFTQPGAVRSFARNVTYQGNQFLTVASGDHEVTFQVTSTDGYIKLAVESARGFSASFWDEVDLELEILAQGSALELPVFSGPHGAVGLWPLDYYVSVSSGSSLRATFSGALLNRGHSASVALLAAADLQSFSGAVEALKGREGEFLPPAAARGLFLRPLDFQPDVHALPHSGFSGLRLDADVEANLPVQLERSLCLQPNTPEFQAALSSSSLAAWGSAVLAAPLAQGAEVLQLTPDAAAQGLLSGLVDASGATAMGTFSQIRRLQLGSEILEATSIDASNLPWRVILAGPASAEAASGAAVRLLRSNADGTWALEPKSAAWEAMLQALPSHLILTELCAEGWAQRQLLFDATRNRSARLAVDWAFPPYVAYTGNSLRSAPVRSFSATARLSLKAELAGKDLYLQGLSFLNALDFGPWLLRSDDASGAFAADGREELEWLLAKVCAFNATAELQVAAALLEAPSATSEVWLTAQRRNWLPRAAREAIANEGCVGDFCSPQGFYRMEGIGTTQLEGSRAWPMSQQVSFHGSSEAAVLTNPWRNQALRFELRVLPAFDKQRAMQLLPQQLSSFEYNQTELSIQAEGDFSFRFRQMSMASFGKASWTLPSPVDMSQTVNGYSGLAINMTGDGLGGLLLLELAGHNRPALRFAVKNNFIGRREVLIPSHEHAEELFPELSFGQDVQASAGRKLPLAALAASDLTVARVSVGLALAPEGASVVVEAQALQNVLSALGNPTIHVKDKTTGEVLSTMSISGCVPPREYLVYEGGSSASLLNEARQLRAELPVEGGAQQPAGDFTVELEASAGDCGVAQPWVKMRWRALGPEAIFNDATTDAALAATTSTTLPQSTTEEEVGAVSLVASINFKVEGLSFRQLVADEALLEQFESVLRGALQSAAQRAGHVSQDLDVQLSAGSVVVQARMTPAVFDGDSRSSVTESLVQGLHSQAESLQQGLISQLAGIEGLSSVTVGAVWVTPVSVSLAHVVAPQETTTAPAEELVPLWALIAVAVFSVCVMIVAFIAMTVQRRWRHKERQRQGRWAGSGDPITMTRRVRAITRRATAFRNLGWKSAGAPKSGPGSMAVIPTGTADTREREEEKSEIKSEMKYVSEGKSDWKSEKTDTCRSQSKDSPQKTKSSEMKQVRFADLEAPSEVQEYDPNSPKGRSQDLEAKVAELEAALKTAQSTLSNTEDKLAEVSLERDKLSLSMTGRLGSESSSRNRSRQSLPNLLASPEDEEKREARVEASDSIVQPARILMETATHAPAKPGFSLCCTSRGEVRANPDDEDMAISRL